MATFEWSLKQFLYQKSFKYSYRTEEDKSCQYVVKAPLVLLRAA